MVQLILFMTERMSLRKWVDKGMFAREIAIYKHLATSHQVTIVSYGTEDESRFLEDCPGIRVFTNTSGLAPEKYIDSLTSHIDFDPLATVVKTNQIKGAHLAVRFARRCGLPLIVRGGYLTSAFVREKRRWNPISKWWQQRAIHQYEKEVFSQANLIVVTTELMRTQILDAYPLPPERIRIVPNYVDTDVFRTPASTGRAPRRLIFVGRMEAQKNLFAFITACARVPNAEVVLIGEGSQRPELEQLAKELSVNATFTGQLPNQELPERIAGASLFVLPSYYEGHPKTLIEAMATGIPVVGTRVEGIRECIQSDVTGLLCNTSPEGISEAINFALDNPDKAQQWGKAGQRFAEETYSLRTILQTERMNIQSLLPKPPGESR
jgi:glycosyltransferase involved in cell wall biosynthesis